MRISCLTATSANAASARSPNKHTADCPAITSETLTENMYTPQRFAQNPLIHPGLDSRIGQNINGPSLIRVPDWVSQPLGRYYLYFAHHQGEFIRLAYADSITGPWEIYSGEVLALADTACIKHIASPDLQICPEEQVFRMYFHGATGHGQRSFLATSKDGLRFQASAADLGPFYFRVFRHQNAWFALAKAPDSPGGGVLLRSPDGIQPFETGPEILPRMRHAALLQTTDSLQIFFSRGRDCPERILYADMPLSGDWMTWRPGEILELLRPETTVEGAQLPLEPSEFGPVHKPVQQLRDPCIFAEPQRLYLLYSGAGESNICGAELLRP